MFILRIDFDLLLLRAILERLRSSSVMPAHACGHVVHDFWLLKAQIFSRDAGNCYLVFEV